MTETEYEDNITSLNTAHEDYAKHIEESKKKIASAITEKGVETSNEETLETMANNIKKIPVKSNIKYIDVSIPNNIGEYTYLSTQISSTAEIIGAGMISREHAGWTGLSIEYTSSQVYTHTVTASSGYLFSGNWIMRVWYIE